MERVLDFVLQLYRTAQETPPAEFQDLALQMLKAFVPFRSASWSQARFDGKTLHFYGLHLHNEPPKILESFASLNSAYPRSIAVASQSPGVAQAFDSMSLYSGRSLAPFREYLTRYGHEHLVMVAGISTPNAKGEWISLYRPRGDRPFDREDTHLLTQLMPHLTEAVTVNRAINFGRAISSTCAGARALVHQSGWVLHCGNRFAELVARQFSDWDRVRLPHALLQRLISRGKIEIADETVTINASTIGRALLLEARVVPAEKRLSPRAYEVARRFATGRSHRQIAVELALSPATVRNFIQQTYRKLGVHDKAQLAGLMFLDRSD